MIISIINGPNLNLLGTREPDIYGHQSFENYFHELKALFGLHELNHFQSNHEGALIDRLHEIGFRNDYGIVLNAGGLTHTSVVLADAVKAIKVPVIEVHVSDIKNREEFRQHSFLTPVCAGHFSGHGLKGYQLAIEALLQL